MQSRTIDLLPSVLVWVPAPHAAIRAIIKPGSAIVGINTGDGRVMCFYEGNLYGAVNLVEFKDKVACAAGRLKHDYPTIAKAWVPKDDLVPVGTYSYPTSTQPEKLTIWKEMAATLNEWKETDGYS